MTDAKIVEIAEQCGLCAVIVVEETESPMVIWFDGDMIPFARAIIEAHENEKALLFPSTR